MAKRRLWSIAALGASLLGGWVIGSVFPITLWSYSDCHRLGGHMLAYYDNGDRLGCIIPVPRP